MHRRRKGIVDDKRHAVRMGDLREALDIKHLHAGIGERLAKDELGFRAEAGLHFLVRRVVVHKGNLDTHLLQRNA